MTRDSHNDVQRGMTPIDCLCNRSAMRLDVQCTIKVKRGTDQGNMSKGLWKVAERFAAVADLLGIQPKMIGVSQHPFKQQSGFRQLRTIDMPRTGQRFHQPKRTHGKRAFSSYEPVFPSLAVVAIDEAIRDQSSLLR